MWWLESRSGLLGLCALCAVLTGCTVEPLYRSLDTRPDGPAIYAVAPAVTRDAQLVRNALLFDLNGGENPKQAARTIELVVVTQVLNVVVERGQQAPTTARVRMETRYTVRDRRQQTIATGTRSAIGAYDRFNQEFANKRAEREAIARTAKVLARRVALAVRQELAGRPLGADPAS